MSSRATFAWSVRREVWEHPAIWIAPLAVASVVVVAMLFNMQILSGLARQLSTLHPEQQASAIVTPLGMVASVIMLSTILVALFYCLDALYGERRDRSILFWKSMPVSDLATVASKAFVPLAVLPLVGFTVALATQALLFGVSIAIASTNGIDLRPVWERLTLLQMPLAMLYGVVVHVLWYAPIYAWLLLVSAWARKAPFLWAVLPVFAVLAVEKIALGTSQVASFLAYRVTGAMREAFTADALNVPVTKLEQLDPLRYLGSPSLWGGLAVAVALLAAAVWLRRRRDPV